MEVLKKAKKDFDNMEYFAFDVTNKEIAQFFNFQYQTTLLIFKDNKDCLLYTSPSPRDLAQSLLFLSFLIATFLPAIILKIKFR